MSQADDRFFSSRAELVPVGDTAVCRFETTTDFWSRTRQQVTSDEREDILINFNRSRRPQSVEQAGKEVVTAAGSVLVTTRALPATCRTDGDVSWIMAAIPRARIRELVPNVDDSIARFIDPRHPAAQHLERYVDWLIRGEPVGEDPALAECVSTMLVDLAALTIGARGQAAELAASRGLRAARLRETLAEIERGFSDPNFSAAVIATRVGISERYVQHLLQEAGATFSERVLELRLQKARAMLADARHDSLKISDIALACGFNEVSYFNRRFRARFGCSPTQWRGPRIDHLVK